MERKLVRLCRQILFNESNLILRVGIRSTMNRLYKKGLDDPQILRRLHKHLPLVTTQKLKAKLHRLLDILEGEDESSDQDPKYTVNSIVGFRVKSDNSRMYLVRWNGYGSDEDSWEPAHQLIEDKCGDLIAQFHREHMKFF
jgi:hypothetical protein